VAIGTADLAFGDLGLEPLEARVPHQGADGSDLLPAHVIELEHPQVTFAAVDTTVHHLPCDVLPESRTPGTFASSDIPHVAFAIVAVMLTLTGAAIGMATIEILR
jgi:hypothetical protein